MPAPPAKLSLRIFLVEDHPDTQDCFKAYLESFGHEVLTASTVAEALAKLPAADCDVLFSDIGLDDGTGWDLMHELRLPEPIFAVAMSGFGLKADQARSRAAGFREHLLKPAQLDRVTKLLDEAAVEAAGRRSGSPPTRTPRPTFERGEP